MGFKHLSALARGLILLGALGILLIGLAQPGPNLGYRRPDTRASVFSTPVPQTFRTFLPYVAKDDQVTSSTPTPTLTASPTPANTSTPTQTYTPMVTATPTSTPIPIPGAPSAGMNLTTSNSEALSQMRDAGVLWARTSVSWSSVEPSNMDLTDSVSGNWPDGWFQTLVNTHGFTPEVIIWKNPSWAALKDCGPLNPTSKYTNDPTSLSEFAQFVGALAARYDGDDDYNNDGTPDGPALPEVLYFELYNEPDFDLDYPHGEPDYGGCWGQAPEAYAQMLRAAYPAMKTGNPQVQVLFGSVAYDRFTDPCNTPPCKPSGYDPQLIGPFDYNFTQNVLTYLYSTYPGNPALPFFDVMNFHNYNDYRNAWDGTMPYDQELLGKIKHIKDDELYVAGLYDVRDIPFLCSEIGAASAPTDTWTVRSEEYQSDYVAQAFGQGMAAGLVANLWFPLADWSQHKRCDQTYDWLMGGALCSADVDQASDACSPNPLPGYSCPVDFGPKPVYEAIEAFIAEMGGVTYDGQLGSSETGSSNIVAFRFNKDDGRKKIVAWTDTEERIGKKGVSPLAKNLDFDASHFGWEWTGQLRVVDKLGNEDILSGGSSITVQITQSPIYIQVAP